MSVGVEVLLWMFGMAAAGAALAWVTRWLTMSVTGSARKAFRIAAVVLVIAAVAVGIVFGGRPAGDGFVAVFGVFSNIILPACLLIGGVGLLSV